jgi:serine/threonine-protein kinase HipA
MNMPEGFMLEELRNRLAKTLHLDEMALLAISGSQAPIGRIQVDPTEITRGLLKRPEIQRGESLTEILEWDGKENIFTELVDKYITRAGISGVQPKVLVPHALEGDAQARATFFAQDLIVKSGCQQYPGLAANEFLCMTIAREAGIPVPDFYLSKNRELFIMKRFDRTPQGAALGFEDMAALGGLSAHEKYDRSYSFMARLVESFASPEHVANSLHALFDIVALSCIVGNGDAHLKNFGLLYTDPTTADCQLAPAYDIVNTTAYIPEDALALELRGQRSFFASRQGLLPFAKECGLANPVTRIQELLLSAEKVLREQDEVCASIPHVVQAIQSGIDAFAQTFMGAKPGP